MLDMNTWVIVRIVLLSSKFGDVEYEYPPIMASNKLLKVKESDPYFSGISV